MLSSCTVVAQGKNNGTVVPLSEDPSVERLLLWKDCPRLGAGDTNTLLYPCDDITNSQSDYYCIFSGVKVQRKTPTHLLCSSFNPKLNSVLCSPCHPQFMHHKEPVIRGCMPQFHLGFRATHGYLVTVSQSCSTETTPLQRSFVF